MGNVTKILIADSNQDFCKILANYINEQEELEVLGITNNGKDTVQIINNSKPDIVLMNIVLPIIDGIDILRRMYLIQWEDKRPIFILFSSINQDKLIKKAIEQFGADYYIVKPFDFELLIKKINQLKNYKFHEKPKKFEEREITKQYLNNNAKGKKTLEIIVTNLLNEMNVPINFKGYYYLREAIILVIKDINFIIEMTKTIYPRIANKFNTTPSRVERAMRTTIERTWAIGDTDVIQTIFGNTVSPDKGKPTNSQFIAMIADKIRLELSSN